VGFHSIVSLAQALERHNFTDPIEISVVSNQIQAVIGNEPLCPAKSTALGGCKVIPQEYPNIRCRSVDIDHCESDGYQEVSRLVERLVTELTVEPFEPVVAYRKGRRWVQTFEAVRLGEAAASAPRLRQGGVYLITGGLGKIGLALAECLARTSGAKLVLTGRSAFPDRNQWKELGKTGETAIRHRIRKLLNLEELGAELMIFSADSADREQMRRVVAYSFVGQTDQAAAEQHFRPKVRGLLVLDEMLRGRELDFFLLLSSLSSVLGGVGQVAYTAASIFLDAFASQQNREGLVPWISVNWDAWRFPAEDEEDGKGSSSFTNPILPEEGIEAFRRILERGPRQILVSPSELKVSIDQWIKLESVSTTPRSQEQSPSLHHPRPNLTNAYLPARTAAEHTLVEIWEQLLGVAPLGTHDNFFELGGHSLLAIQLISRLREAFQIEFPVQRLFEAPTIAELAESIDKKRAAVEEEAEVRTAQILDLVEQFSESQVAALLERTDNSLEKEKLPGA
jgi:acyl carrier protein